MNKIKPVGYILLLILCAVCTIYGLALMDIRNAQHVRGLLLELGYKPVVYNDSCMVPIKGIWMPCETALRNRLPVIN